MSTGKLHERICAPYGVLRCTPLLAEAARPCRHRVGGRWFVDETYVRVAGRWRYVYRAIDQFGRHCCIEPDGVG
jgi:transposase-like protein